MTLFQHSLIFIVSLIWIQVIYCASNKNPQRNLLCGKCRCVLEEDDCLTLNCSRRELEAIENHWFKNVSKLEHDGNVMLTYSNNNISLLTRLPSLPGHRIAVSLKNNEIQDIEDGSFAQIKHIYYLDLSYNLLTGDAMRGEIFEGPYDENAFDYEPLDLEVLKIDHNLIHSLDRRLFEHTPNLTKLFINDNPFEMLDSVTILALSSATRLEILDMSNIEIESIPWETFHQLTNLQQLDLSGNKFKTVPASTGLLTNLLMLTFNNNPIEELNDESFQGLVNLNALEVSDNEDLEAVRSSTFSPLVNLKKLHLCHNPNLRFISSNAFRNTKKSWTLEEVHFDDNNLSKLPRDLMPWDKLKTLGLNGNNWKCDCNLGYIIVTQGAGLKLDKNHLPTCISPMKSSGAYITDIAIESCPDLEEGKGGKKLKGFSLNKIKPKHIIWTLVGVAAVAIIGMGLGLIFNYSKALLQGKKSTERIAYMNINVHNFGI